MIDKIVVSEKRFEKRKWSVVRNLWNIRKMPVAICQWLITVLKFQLKVKQKQNEDRIEIVLKVNQLN